MHDTNKDGVLQKTEARQFLQTALTDLPPPNKFDENEFEEAFAEADLNGDGVIDKEEGVAFIREVLEMKRDEEQERIQQQEGK